MYISLTNDQLTCIMFHNIMTIEKSAQFPVDQAHGGSLGVWSAAVQRWSISLRRAAVLLNCIFNFNFNHLFSFFNFFCYAMFFTQSPYYVTPKGGSSYGYLHVVCITRILVANLQCCRSVGCSIGTEHLRRSPMRRCNVRMCTFL